jgi:hypothetical protein
MYDPAVNRVAMAAMRNLHPEMIASVKSRALYSSAEEILLARVPAVIKYSSSVRMFAVKLFFHLEFPTRFGCFYKIAGGKRHCVLRK